MSAFVPPQASKLGVSTSDLTSKKFESSEKYVVALTTQSKNIVATQTINTATGNLDKLEGKVNIKYADKAWGDSSLEFDTKGKAISNTTLSQLAPGVNVALRLEYDTTVASCADKKCPVATQLTAQYKQEGVATTLEYNQKKNQLIKALSLGYEGFTVGAILTTKLGDLQTQGLAKAVSANGGLQYEDRNLTGTVFLESNNNIGLSVFHNLNKETQVGAKALITSKTGGRNGNSLAVAAQHKLNPSTLVKGKVQVYDDKSFILGSFIEHKLPTPNMTVGVSTTWDSTKQKPVFGINAAFTAK